MPINQLDLVLQFSIRVATILFITAMALKAARRLARPVGTYGAGLPERRSRPRIVLQVRPLPVPPQEQPAVTDKAA